MTFLLANWKLLAIFGIVALLGVQTYRFQGASDELRLLSERETARLRAEAHRDATNNRNRERTDEEYAAAKSRAANVVVRNDGGSITAKPILASGSGNAAADCVSRGQLAEALTGFAERNAKRLDAISDGNRGRSEEIARLAEGVSAAYRSCRAYAVNLE